MRLIPAIDLRGGRCVRLHQGDFDAETRYDVEPRTLVDRYGALGADWLHVVDLDGARDGSAGNREIIASLTQHTSMKLQVGGGLRNVAAVTQMLELGASRVVIGSAALIRGDEVRNWLGYFGVERVALAFDVRVGPDEVPRVATHGWRNQSDLSLWDAVASFTGEGLRHVLCTDVSRDGARSGPNVPLYAAAVARYPRIEWQASGGVRNVEDLRALDQAGARAAVSGTALLEGLIEPVDLRPFLPNA